MTARDRIVIVVVLAIAAVAAAWVFVVSPKRSQASSLNGQIATEQSQLDTVSSQVAAGKAARSAFAPGDWPRLPARTVAGRRPPRRRSSVEPMSSGGFVRRSRACCGREGAGS